MSTSRPPTQMSSPPVTSPRRTTHALNGIFASSTGPMRGRQGATAAKAMLGHDAVDARPSYFYSDQYDLGMEYTGDIGPAGYDKVIFRRHADPKEVIVFWLNQQRVQAGMNVNIWDVAEDIERLIESASPVKAEDLADPESPLSTLPYRSLVSQRS